MGDVPEMVERVARALAPEAWAALTGKDAQHFVVARRLSVLNARAAIEAMREPTEAMRYAVWYDQYITCGGTRELADFCAREKLADEKQRRQDLSSFSALIDAALASQGNGREGK